MADRRNIARVRMGGAIAMILCLTILCFGHIALAGSNRTTESNSLESAAGGFKSYVTQQIAKCLYSTKQMRERIAAHDLLGAQQAWLAARGGWEGSEVITNEFFPDLDRKIDAWPDAQKGFHAIEAKLFGAHDVQALPGAEELVNDLTEFEQQLRTTTFTAQGLLNGTAKLIYEIGENKAEGGESPFSGNSLAEIRDNVASIAITYERVFAPATKKRNAEVARLFAADLRQMQALVSVPTLRELDQLRLRDVSESLVNDLAIVGRASGLEKPGLGN